MSETRKIAAILVADVVGYSRLAGADEDRTLARLRALRSDLIDPAIAVHHGRLVKRTGDGSLIEFRSVVDAVRFAIEMQSGMVERNAGLPPDRRIEFRVGIHLGDVVEESDGDLMGDGVNIAARLEGIAKPGAICLSEDAYRQVKQRLDLAVADLGPAQLKNIAEPIRVYSLEVGAPAQAKPAPAPPPEKTAPPRLSIVVLPFANIGSDPEQEYFVDGVTESLTTDVSRIAGAFVIARNTAFTYKGSPVDVKAIGRELNVRYVLEGSVQRAANRMRVNVQLVDAKTGAHLWAERFDKPVVDLFDMQDEIVARLANSLGYELVKAEAQRGAHSSDPDVIDLTMHGWTLIWRGHLQAMKDRRESYREARSLFDRALRTDPNSADALAGSAYTHFNDYLLGWSDAETDYEHTVLGQASRAIALAPDNVRAYYVKAVYLSLSRRPSEALRIADAGLAINPNFVSLLSPRIVAEISLGRFEQAKADVQRAMRLSPRDAFIGTLRVEMGDAELGLGNCDAAIDAYRKAIDSGFQQFFVHTNLSAAYAHAGRMDEAKASLAEARRLNPKLTIRYMIERTPNLPPVFEGLRKAGLPEE
jgi:adenylate cyclase